MLSGVVYWAGWRVVLPALFGYELVAHKEKLKDGTVLTVVRIVKPLSRRHMRLIGLVVQVFTS